MPNYNSVTIIGHLTRGIDLRSAASGTQWCEGGIAFNDRKKKGHFFDFKAFNKTAEMLAGHFEKGDAVGLVGELAQESWDDKKTGQKRSKVVILVNQIIFLGQKADRGDSAPPPERGANVKPVDDAGYDDYATTL